MTTCTAVTTTGAPCRATNVRETPDGPRCLWHDASRQGEARAARSRGGKGRCEQRDHGGPRTKTVTPDQLPDLPLDNIEAVVVWLVWLARVTLTGVIDPATSREANRILVTLKAALDVRALKQEVRELRSTVKTLRKKLEGKTS
jgi:hypothetical protein